MKFHKYIKKAIFFNEFQNIQFRNNKIVTVKQSAAYIFAGYLYLKLLYLSLACEIETSATSLFNEQSIIIWNPDFEMNNEYTFIYLNK